MKEKETIKNPCTCNAQREGGTCEYWCASRQPVNPFGKVATLPNIREANHQQGVGQSECGAMSPDEADRFH